MLIENRFERTHFCNGILFAAGANVRIIVECFFDFVFIFGEEGDANSSQLSSESQAAAPSEKIQIRSRLTEHDAFISVEWCVPAQTKDVQPRQRNRKTTELAKLECI